VSSDRARYWNDRSLNFLRWECGNRNVTHPARWYAQYALGLTSLDSESLLMIPLRKWIFSLRFRTLPSESLVSFRSSRFLKHETPHCVLMARIARRYRRSKRHRRVQLRGKRSTLVSTILYYRYYLIARFVRVSVCPPFQRYDRWTGSIQLRSSQRENPLKVYGSEKVSTRRKSIDNVQ